MATRPEFDEELDARGVRAIREDSEYDDGDGVLMLIKKCPRGCPGWTMSMNPNIYDAEVLDLHLDQIAARDCEHRPPAW